MLKKFGKFIKKDSQVSNLASIKDFSFENIASYPFVLFDNKSRSLIQPDLHSKESLDSIVNSENRCDKDLVSSEGKRGLLWPVDFTQEIRQGEEYGKLLKNYQFGNEVIESEAVMQDFGEGMEDLTREADSEDQSEDEEEARYNKKETKEDNHFSFNQKISDDNFVNSSSSMDPNSLDNIDQSETNSDGEYTKDSTLMQSSIVDEKSDNQDSQNLETDDKNENATLETLKEDKVISSDTYLNQDLSGMEEKLKEEYQKGYDKAKEEFEKTSKEEKQSVDEKIELITNNVKSIVEGLSGLKKSILASANKNYYEIAQAVSETLLRKEITADESLLQSLIEQAIQKIPENNITVKVSKNMYDRLMSVTANKELQSIIKADSSVEDGDFRVESDLNVIDGTVYNMVKDILKDFKLDLYEHGDNTQDKLQEESREEAFNKVS